MRRHDEQNHLQSDTPIGAGGDRCVPRHADVTVAYQLVNAQTELVRTLRGDAELQPNLRPSRAVRDPDCCRSARQKRTVRRDNSRHTNSRDVVQHRCT